MKVLMSAYACEPGKGSEPGAGWAWTRAAALDHEVWVMTRENNRDAIDEALRLEPNLRLTPIYLDLPKWARWWKRGGRGLRLYYVLWQGMARRRAKQLHKQIHFDVAHHITLAIDSLPAGVIGIKGLPSVWGPVGGASPFPWLLRRHLGLLGFCKESARFVLSGVARRTSGRRTARAAHLVVVQNREVYNSFAQFDPIVEPNVALDQRDFAKSASGPSAAAPVLGRVALFVGNLIPLKGLTLALEAIANDSTGLWNLTVFGGGPDSKRAKSMVDRLGIQQRVQFQGQRPRSEVLAALRHADALMFPSVHDSAAWTVGEAMMSGVFVVCLDLCGPAELVRRAGCGRAIKPTSLAPQIMIDTLNGVNACRPDVSVLQRDRIPALTTQWYSTAVERGGRAPASPRSL